MQVGVADEAKATAEAAVQQSEVLLADFDEYLADHVSDISYGAD